MRIFISHASKNKEIILKFAELLESINSNIEVFCSSENGSIKIGENFVETIFSELDGSDIFVPDNACAFITGCNTNGKI